MRSDTSFTRTPKKSFYVPVFPFRYHLIGWAIFITYEVLLNGLYLMHFRPITNYITAYAVNIGLFYTHAYFTMKHAFRSSISKIIVLPVYLIIEYTIYIATLFSIQYFFIYHTNWIDEKTITFSLQYVLGCLIRSTYFILSASGYFFFMNYLKERKKTTELEEQRLENKIQIAESENAYLRAQINPHFLFNTLDFIYHNAIERAPVAADAISSLSGMMRYSIDSAHAGQFVSLDQEITQVESLINLHQIRENYTLYIHFWYEEELRNLSIIPLVLATLVENMFKHGDLRNAEHAAKIQLDLLGNDLLIATRNRIHPNKGGNGLGSGLNNLQKRLHFAYGEDAKLHIEQNDDYFELTLQISGIKNQLAKN